MGNRSVLRVDPGLVFPVLSSVGCRAIGNSLLMGKVDRKVVIIPHMESEMFLCQNVSRVRHIARG